jgi:murein DD-endopeptidase MepM/ murein hydrolase activator NlpD
VPSPSPSRSIGSLPTRGAVLLVLLALVAGAALGGGAAPAQAASQQQLQRLRGKVDSAKHRVDERKDRERVLTSDVQGFSTRIGALQTKIDGLQRRQDDIQAALDASQALLTGTQRDLRAERRRLVALRARLRQARKVLAARLVELYQSDKPDLVSVVVNSDGFSDLLERGEFLARIERQDQQIMRSVRTAQVDAVATEAKLTRLERVRRTSTGRIEARWDEIVQVKGGLVGARGMLDEQRRKRSALLSKVKMERHDVEEDLKAMQREESKIQGRLSGLPGGGPVKHGSGALDWPVDGQLTSSFGGRWGKLHAGLDIAVPEGTPVRAADAGTVAIAGWVGGYGNYVCVDHGGGLSTCYGHNSRLGVSVGQRVGKGQTIAMSGNTGHSTGPHVHFETRVGGVPRDPMEYL